LDGPGDFGKHRKQMGLAMKSTLPAPRLAGVAVAISLVAPLLATPARAADPTDQLLEIQKQISALQAELARVKRDLAAQSAKERATAAQIEKERAAQAKAVPVVAPTPQVPPGYMLVPATPNTLTTAQVAPPFAPQPEGPKLGKGQFRVGDVTITLGGFIELAGLYRSRNEVADIPTAWNGIPLSFLPQAHQGEFRMTARQSRFNVLAEGNIDDAQKLSAFVETDFLSAAPTANSVESNSYNPRLRQAYAAYDNSDWGLHVLAGQAWTLLTQNKIGITPRQENIPLTIEHQLVPGFTWARQPQLRVAKDFDDQKLWIAASLENPQTSFSTPTTTTTFNGQTITTTLPGGNFFAPNVLYSDNIAPDLIAKVAYDPGWGHYEAYGVLRVMSDRVSFLGGGSNNNSIAGGGGASMILPLIPGKLDFQASVLAGVGISRYGTSLLPDATVGPSGQVVPLPEVQALIGLVGHPIPSVDLYSYIGTEQIQAKFSTVNGINFGYGNPNFSNAGCSIELSTATCTADTSGITQGTLGAWWRFYQGNFGTAQVGAQYSYTRRAIFRGVGGAPTTDENIVMLSLRYFPFQ
jgi:hypothetical protein